MLAMTAAALLMSLPAARAADPDPLLGGIGQLLDISRLLRGGDGFVLSPLTQSQFESLAGDVSAALDLRAADAGLPPGDGRWRVSLLADRTATDSAALWQGATGDRREHLWAGRLLVERGFGDRLGVGVAWSRLPSNDAQLWGAHANLLLAGNTADGPALALSASHNRLSGVEGLDARGNSAALTGSWALGPWRPYVGVGAVDGRVSASGDVAYHADTRLIRGFAGLQLASGPLQLGAELGSSDGRLYQTLRISYLFD